MHLLIFRSVRRRISWNIFSKTANSENNAMNVRVLIFCNQKCIEIRYRKAFLGHLFHPSAAVRLSPITYFLEFFFCLILNVWFPSVQTDLTYFHLGQLKWLLNNAIFQGSILYPPPK